MVPLLLVLMTGWLESLGVIVFTCGSRIGSVRGGKLCPLSRSNTSPVGLVDFFSGARENVQMFTLCNIFISDDGSDVHRRPESNYFINNVQDTINCHSGRALRP